MDASLRSVSTLATPFGNSKRTSAQFLNFVDATETAVTLTVIKSVNDARTVSIFFTFPPEHVLGDYRKNQQFTHGFRYQPRSLAFDFPLTSVDFLR